ncbi:MAG: hypothetical protein ACE5LC_10825 [Candidatus Aminicenantales bacterium]
MQAIRPLAQLFLGVSVVLLTYVLLIIINDTLELLGKKPFKMPYDRLPIISALILLGLCPFLLIWKKEKLADEVAIYAYFLLVVGVVIQVVEMAIGDEKIAKLAAFYRTPRGKRRLAYIGTGLAAICVTAIFGFAYIAPPPEVYKWLARQPGDFVVAEYPMVTKEGNLERKYFKYQGAYKKRLLNRLISASFIGKEDIGLEDLAREEIAPLLNYMKVGYVIVHLDRYRNKFLDFLMINKNPGLELVKVFENTFVYRVRAEPKGLVVVPGKNFYPLEVWGDGKKRRWMINNGRISLINTGETEDKIDLGFFAESFYKRRTLEILLNGELVNTTKIPPWPISVILQDLKVRPGVNIISLHCPEGPEKVSARLGTLDNRYVSIALSPFQYGKNLALAKEEVKVRGKEE